MRVQSRKSASVLSNIARSCFVVRVVHSAHRRASDRVATAREKTTYTWLEDEHAVSEGVETVAPLDGLAVGTHRELVASEGGSKHQRRKPGHVQICKKSITEASGVQHTFSVLSVRCRIAVDRYDGAQ